MRIHFVALSKKAQTAVEYMLLLAAVVSIVLIGFKNYLPSFQLTSNYYYNQIGIGVLGEPNRCGDGVCSSAEKRDNWANPGCENCPVDCGSCS